MIKEDYVSFEVAKLLKEKGFPEGYQHTNYFMDENGNQATCTIREAIGKNITTIPRPTLQMAMKWLREVHRIEIHIALSELNADNIRTYMFDIFSSDINRDFDSIQEFDFNSYEEACEKSIKFCLENLI